MYHKIVNPETKRLVDINGRIGRKVLARYVSISKIGNTLNLEQTGGSYNEGDIMILYGGGLKGPTSTSKEDTKFMSTIQVAEPLTPDAKMVLDARNVKSTLNSIDRQFQSMFSEGERFEGVEYGIVGTVTETAAGGAAITGKNCDEHEANSGRPVDQVKSCVFNFPSLKDTIRSVKQGREYKITSTHKNCTAIAEILNYYNKSNKSTYENGHPVIIEVPKEGDKTLKEVLGPVSGGKKYKQSKVNNCVHTGGLNYKDKPKIRKFGNSEMAMLIDFINREENKAIMEKNKKLAFHLCKVWPRC